MRAVERPAVFPGSTTSIRTKERRDALLAEESPPIQIWTEIPSSSEIFSATVFQ
jgi:hypothetical protein